MLVLNVESLTRINPSDEHLTLMAKAEVIWYERDNQTYRKLGLMGPLTGFDNRIFYNLHISKSPYVLSKENHQVEYLDI